MWDCTAPELFTAVLLGLLVAVQSCGHHIVHSQIKSLAARHVAQQAHMAEHWGLRTAARTGGRAKVGGGGHYPNLDGVHERQRTATRGKQGEDEEKDWPGGASHGHRHDHEDGDDLHQEYDYGDHDGVDDIGDLEGLEEADAQLGHSQSGFTLNGGWDVEDEDDGEEAQEEEEKAVRGQQRRRRSLQQFSTPAPAPIRLSVTYQMLGALDASQQQTLTRVVEAVRRILQKFVNVKHPSVGGLLVDPYCDWRLVSCYPDFKSSSQYPDRECGLATILREHIVDPNNCTSRATRAQRDTLGRGASRPASGAGGGASGYGTGCLSFAGTKGEETDMYLYITAVENDDCAAGAAAWARPCLLDLGNNRPLLGAANVCPRALGLLDEDALTAVLTHEMIHALGFTDSMYNLTRRPDGTLRPFSELVGAATVGGRRVQLLVSPNVRAAARAQFGCDSLAGAQLEEEGSAGSAGSHWEYTHYQGEVMVASTIFAADGSPPALSNLTLAYLDDTGWYVTNRASAGLLSWGAGAGCALPTRSCSEYMASVPGQRLFCDAAAAAQSGPTFMCSNSYKANGVCRALNFTGGCGMIMSRDAEQTCMGPNAANDMPEVFGWGTGSPSGRCLPVVYRFQVSVGFNRITYPSLGRDGDADAACFDTVCHPNGVNVSVKMLGLTLNCPVGDYIILPQHLSTRYNAGRIGPCPPASALCRTQSCAASACNPIGGDCLDGTCYCHLSYTGRDCSYNLITGQPESEVLGAGINGGAASSPPPPLVVWTQVVQLTLALNHTAAYVNARIPLLRTIIATWAGLNDSAVAINNVAGGGRSSAVLGDGSAAGDSYDATATAAAMTRRRRRGLHQAQGLPSTPPPPSATVAMATAWLTPSNSRPAAMLLSWLKNNVTQRNRLINLLAGGGLYVVADGISSESIITRSMSAFPPPALQLTATKDPADARSNRGRTIIIIALAVGGIAVAGILVTVITVVVIRSRRNRRRSAAATATAAGRAQLYQLPPMPSIGSGSGAGVGIAPGTAAAAVAPSSNPFAATTGSGAGTWYGSGGAAAPETAAYSYYSSHAASMASSTVGQQPQAPYNYPYQPGGTGPLSPLYSGPQDRSYS